MCTRPGDMYKKSNQKIMKITILINALAIFATGIMLSDNVPTRKLGDVSASESLLIDQEKSLANDEKPLTPKVLKKSKVPPASPK